jgi:metal-sulfur cluster biosynthetic enzyme
MMDMMGMPPMGGSTVDPNLEATINDVINHEETKQKYNEQIVANLKKCYDPEISIDIYTLGLIYDFKVTEDSTVHVLMSLTSAFCPAVDMILADVKSQVESIEGIKECKITITMVPQWGKEMIDPEVVELMGW